jgi:hypothetical protein
MQPQGSAFPGVTPDAMSFLENLDERSARFSQEPEDEFPAAFKERRRVVRRRPNMVQGRSLEKLGHAVEYLVDSRMFLVEPATAKAEREAVRILMRLSRMVFSECEEVVTLWDRVVELLERPAKRSRAIPREASGLPQL